MPLDPQECRRQALACVRLAQTSISPQARLHYANLAKTWLTLAGDLDDRNAPKVPSCAIRLSLSALAGIDRLHPVSERRLRRRGILQRHHFGHGAGLELNELINHC